MLPERTSSRGEMEALPRCLHSDSFACHFVEVKGNKRPGLFFCFCISKGKLRQCSILRIFLVCRGDHGAPAPLAPPGRAVFAAVNTGAESRESACGTGNPLIWWAFMPIFSA